MRYILFILMLIGGLLSFNSYAAVTGQCSASAPPVYGPYVFYFSGGSMHINIDGCDYISRDNPVLVNDETDYNSPPVSYEGNWYPTGKKSDEVVKDKPVNTGWKDDQFDRYCSQVGKCDSKGDPVNISDWLKFKEKDDAAHNTPSEKPGDNSSDKPGSGSSGSDDSASTDGGSGSPDGTDNGTGVTGGTSDGSTSGTSSGSSTPSPSQPQKPYPADAGASQLLGLYESCYSQAFSFPGDDDYDNAFNSVARNCNAILDRLSSILAPGKMHLLSDDGRKFLIKSGSGVLYCHKTTDMERQEMLNRGYPSSMIPDAAGSSLKGIPYRDGHLNFNYSSNNGANSYCDSAYQNFISSQNKPSDNSDNSDNFPSHETSNNTGTSSGGGASSYEPVNCPSGFHLSDVDGKTCFQVDSDGNVSFILPDNCSYGSDCWNSTYEAAHSGAEHLRVSGSSSGASGSSSGVGHSDSGDGDNGDVVAAINAFHADANKHHEETMNALDTSGASLDGAKAGLSSDISSLTDSLKKEMTDSYNAALSEFKDVFGDIDSYIPDFKLSFDLPVQFTNGIRGRCVPLVFDFNITLIGFQPYHFHAEGIQACQLYDAYIRSIVEYMLYFLTALACRRVFTRAAEFVSSQP
ncbi:hypothetical protein H8526_005506 [Salmonella enterica]|nr:hypothetical protein [Salmonella enterica]